MQVPSPERCSEDNEMDQNQPPDHQIRSFRWDEYEENVRRSYQQLREKKLFHDVTISCEDSEVEAHKLVLAASSDFFSDMLERTSFKNNPHPIIFIQDVKMKHFMFVLEFMYTGEVKVPQNDITFVVQAAKDLEVKGLQTYQFDELDNGTGKRKADQFSPSCSLDFPCNKRSRTESFSSILSSSGGSSPIHIDDVEDSRSLNYMPEKVEDDALEDENDKLEKAEDDKLKDEDDKQEKAEDDTQKDEVDIMMNGSHSIVEPSETDIAVSDDSVIETATSLGQTSDEKMLKESQRSVLVEKVNSELFKCKKCKYTSKNEANASKHVEFHLRLSMVTNEDDMKDKHDKRKAKHSRRSIELQIGDETLEHIRLYSGQYVRRESLLKKRGKEVNSGQNERRESLLKKGGKEVDSGQNERRERRKLTRGKM